MFPLMEQMDLAKDKGPVSNGFSWLDVAEKKRYLFELDESSNDNMFSLFQLTASQCMYEAKYQKPSANVPLEDLDHFVKYVSIILVVANCLQRKSLSSL